MTDGTACATCGTPLDVRAARCLACGAAADADDASASATMPILAASPWARPTGATAIEAADADDAEPPQRPSVPLIEEHDVPASGSEMWERPIDHSTGRPLLEPTELTLDDDAGSAGATMRGISSSELRAVTSAPMPVVDVPSAAVAASALPRRSRATTQSPFLARSPTTHPGTNVTPYAADRIRRPSTPPSTPVPALAPAEPAAEVAVIVDAAPAAAPAAAPPWEDVSSPYAPRARRRPTASYEPVPGASGSLAAVDEAVAPPPAVLEPVPSESPYAPRSAPRVTAQPVDPVAVAAPPVEELSPYAPGARRVAAPYSPFTGPPPPAPIPGYVAWQRAGERPPRLGRVLAISAVAIAALVTLFWALDRKGTAGTSREQLVAGAVAALAAEDLERLERLSVPEDLRLTDCTSPSASERRSSMRDSHRRAIRRMRAYKERIDASRLKLNVLRIGADEDPSRYRRGQIAMGARSEECEYLRDVVVHRLEVDVRVNDDREEQMRVAAVEVAGRWYLADFLIGGAVMDEE